ncbi:DUF397 domain-containing protein [Streptomyces roseirectus]|uniref:DUF397 domain-containing protein n=2 Tax=Streptomyces roseirectus TaxID=2768066 RepID=A0A7H0IT12_9ACTN|nr:DUF397 domain-containing protein [Streptomyces roseirectus]
MFDHLRSQAADTAADNECVEVAVTAAGPSVRDSKAPALGTLTLAASSFSAFVNSLAMDGVR